MTELQFWFHAISSLNPYFEVFLSRSLLCHFSCFFSLASRSLLSFAPKSKSPWVPLENKIFLATLTYFQKWNPHFSASKSTGTLWPASNCTESISWSFLCRVPLGPPKIKNVQKMVSHLQLVASQKKTTGSKKLLSTMMVVGKGRKNIKVMRS